MPEETDLTEKVHKLFRAKGLSLSVAESCTGGLISHYITSLPGASKFFTAGITAYSEDIKKKLLTVSAEVISKYGVVSKETACEMAEKMRLLSGTDFSVSATGNIGPDIIEGKEKGLVYVAASCEGETLTRKLNLKGSREENKKEAAIAALKLLMGLVTSYNRKSI